MDSTGFAEAAVATGAVDMPLKLPAPDLGTDAQPEPKSDVVAEPPPDGMAEAIDDELDGMAEDALADGDDEDDADVPLLLLQAAVPRASPAAVTEIARIRPFTISPLIRSFLSSLGPGLGPPSEVAAVR
ncbi:MAG TPA: hypothetical protein VGD68_00230 [Streptosporangiaceae bacterium]